MFQTSWACLAFQEAQSNVSFYEEHVTWPEMQEATSQKKCEKIEFFDRRIDILGERVHEECRQGIDIRYG